jgi:hypothetical protein
LLHPLAGRATGLVKDNPRVRLPVDDLAKLAEILERKLTPTNLRLLIIALRGPERSTLAQLLGYVTELEREIALLKGRGSGTS